MEFGRFRAGVYSALLASGAIDDHDANTNDGIHCGSLVAVGNSRVIANEEFR